VQQHRTSRPKNFDFQLYLDMNKIQDKNTGEGTSPEFGGEVIIFIHMDGLSKEFENSSNRKNGNGIRMNDCMECESLDN